MKGAAEVVPGNAGRTHGGQLTVELTAAGDSDIGRGKEGRGRLITHTRHMSEMPLVRVLDGMRSR